MVRPDAEPAAPSEHAEEPKSRRAAKVAPVLFFVFFLSGALALTYQLAWVRGLTLELGATVPAVATVVSIFLGGLGLGAHLGGRRGDRLERPLYVYGLLEIGIAAYALLSPLLLTGLLPAVSRAAGGAGLDLSLMPLVRVATAALLLSPPTVLMGATLPVLSRFYVRRLGEGGRGAGVLYGINTLGATAGAFCAGLALLPALGLAWALVLAGGANLVLAIVVLGLSRTWDRGARPPAEAAAEAAAELSPAALAGGRRLRTAGARRWILGAVAASACAATICQVVWTRVLELVLGPSLYVATIAIGTFVGGIGLGAFAMALGERRRPEAARYHLFILTLLAAAAVALSAYCTGLLPDVFRILYFRWELAERFHALFFSQLALASLVMLPAAAALGAILPAAIRALVHEDGHTSRRTGGAYAWDTVGSIAGALVAGFAMVPIFGVQTSMIVAIALLGAAAFASIAWMPRRPRLFLAAGAVAAVAALALATPTWNQSLMTSGMYHYAEYYRHLDEPTLAEEIEAREPLLYYRDGRAATVTVTRDETIAAQPKYLYISGKIEGSTGFDMRTQRLLSHIPLMAHPSPRRVAVMGMGTGVTAGSVTAHDVDEVAIAEIEPAVVEAARLFAGENRGVHDREEVSIVATDGRLFQRLHPEAFDVVISQPSNPWFGGAVDLFTREYYELGADALRPGGVFAQWIQLYSLSPENVRTLLRTFADVFPHVYLYSAMTASDVVVLGAKEPLSLDLERIESLLERPAVREDLADPRVGAASAGALLSRFRMGPDAIEAFAGEGPLNRDARPIVGYRAARDLYRETGLENDEAIAAAAEPLAGHLRGLPADGDALASLRREILRSCRDHAASEGLCGRLVRGL